MRMWCVHCLEDDSVVFESSNVWDAIYVANELNFACYMTVKEVEEE